MSSIPNFSRAINVAEESAEQLMPGVTQMKLEGVIVAGKYFEVTLSYFMAGRSPLELAGGRKKESIGIIASMMTSRREYKVFLVDKNTFAFAGFKAYKEQ